MVEALGELEDIRSEWESLGRASGNPFASVEWAEAWLAHASAGSRLRLFGARRADDGRLAAIVPLVIVHGRYVRKARFLGFGAANELGPVSAASDRELGVAALRESLAATRGEWDLFLGESLPGTGWAASLGGRSVAHLGSPVARGPWTSWDDYLATRSRNLRQQLRQKERRLVDQGLEYRTVSSAAELGPGLDALFALHRARWGDAASPWFAGLEGFHRAFASAAFERGWLRLRLLELGGRPVAANYSFRFGDAEWSYQHGRDLSLEDHSIGLLIFARSVREAFAEGAREFKLGPGVQEYKLRFANADEGLETVGIARGLRGRAALLAAQRRAR